MGAKINYLFVAESADLEFFKRMVMRLTPQIHQMLGELKTAAVHDTHTNTIRESSIDISLDDGLPTFMEHEILTLYSQEMQDGCVMLTYEGAFMVISIALHSAPNRLGFLMECWQRIGKDLNAALMGEELEVTERELDSLIREARLPKEMDLCEAAIVKFRHESAASIVGRDVEYGAVLVIPKP